MFTLPNNFLLVALWIISAFSYFVSLYLLLSMNWLPWEIFLKNFNVCATMLDAGFLSPPSTTDWTKVLKHFSVVYWIKRITYMHFIPWLTKRLSKVVTTNLFSNLKLEIKMRYGCLSNLLSIAWFHRQPQISAWLKRILKIGRKVGKIELQPIWNFRFKVNIIKKCLSSYLTKQRFLLQR